MKFIEHTISNHIAYAMLYADLSAVSDAEEALMDKFSEKYGHVMLDDTIEHDFARCEVTGLHGDCINVVTEEK